MVNEEVIDQTSTKFSNPNNTNKIIIHVKNTGNRFKRLLREYCEISTIQGFSYLIKDISLFERLWWIAVLLSCVTGCSIMIYQVFDKWITTPVLVSLATQEAPIYGVPFPAVTICPETKIKNQCLNYTKVLMARKTGNFSNISFSESQNFDYMMPLCTSSNHETKLKEQEMNSTVRPFSRHESKSLDDYAKFLSECAAIDLSVNSYCQWMGEDADCEEILTPILTDEGLCYSFNMFDVRDIYSDVNRMTYYRAGERNLDWYPDGQGFPADKLDDTYPRRAFSNGARNSLIVALFTGKSDIYYSCREFALQGIRVSLHMPATIPRPSQLFFSVGLDRLTTVAVTPTLMETTDSIQDYDPHRRNCYFKDEKKLKYFKIYTQGNCNLECWTNFTMKHCGCSDFYMPRDNKTKICDISRRRCLASARVTYPQTILSERLRSSELESDCDCLPLCSDLNYNSEISIGNWQFNDPDDVALDGIRELFDQFRSSAVRVYFKDVFFLPTQKSELYGLTDFISNIGGVLGLFTGFTLFSVAEIIYFLSIKLIENYRKYGHWYGEEARIEI